MSEKKNTTTSKKNGSRRIALFRDTSLNFPKLYLQVYLAGENEVENSLLRRMFVRGGCWQAETPEEADLVVFGGGADVDPQLYGASTHNTTEIDPARDEEDLALWDICFHKGIPMLGICRGAQFGHVMCGGTLFQNVNNHNGDHSIYDEKNNRTITRVSSVHHQMVRPNARMDVIARCAGKSTQRAIDASSFETGPDKDIEAFFYRDVCFLGIQGHPEYSGYWSYQQWALRQINDYINNNPDLEKMDRRVRLKTNILDQRDDFTRTNQILKENA